MTSIRCHSWKKEGRNNALALSKCGSLWRQRKRVRKKRETLDSQRLGVIPWHFQRRVIWSRSPSFIINCYYPPLPLVTDLWRDISHLTRFLNFCGYLVIMDGVIIILNHEHHKFPVFAHSTPLRRNVTTCFGCSHIIFHYAIVLWILIFSCWSLFKFIRILNAYDSQLH